MGVRRRRWCEAILDTFARVRIIRRVHRHRRLRAWLKPVWCRARNRLMLRCIFLPAAVPWIAALVVLVAHSVPLLIDLSTPREWQI